MSNPLILLLITSQQCNHRRGSRFCSLKRKRLPRRRRCSQPVATPTSRVTGSSSVAERFSILLILAYLSLHASVVYRAMFFCCYLAVSDSSAESHVTSVHQVINLRESSVKIGTLSEQTAAEGKGWRKEGRRLEEWTSSEEKDLSEGVVSMSVSRSVPSFSDFNFVFSFPFIFIHIF